ncbi:MAG TPA: D-glycerate dehydrogenase [Steroidobacteraceae bacterium]|nr:D-glycerate dehydrogenase [Steroidobacteraceae bacterium]
MPNAATPVSKPRIAVTRRLPGPVEARAQRDYDALLNPTDTPWTATDWSQRTAGASGVLCTVTDKVDAAVIAALPDSVRILATFSVGFNHIDLAAARSRGLVVTNTPDVLTDATADIAMLLLIGTARRAGEGEALMRARKWEGWGPTAMLGTNVTGKTLGIVGLGRIGSAVARRATAFGMSIHYLSPRPKPTPGFSAIHHASEATFWPQCQFVSLHLPTNEHTRGFLNAARLAQLPRGAFVVNTARGEIVDDDALIAALKSGHLGGAGLDVYTGEPNFRAEYATLPNTFLLPHLGSATFETRCAMGFRALDNLDAFLSGRPPPDRVA